LYTDKDFERCARNLTGCTYLRCEEYDIHPNKSIFRGSKYIHVYPICSTMLSMRLSELAMFQTCLEKLSSTPNISMVSRAAAYDFPTRLTKTSCMFFSHNDDTTAIT
jgi:hypothetical protein